MGKGGIEPPRHELQSCTLPLSYIPVKKERNSQLLNVFKLSSLLLLMGQSKEIVLKLIGSLLFIIGVFGYYLAIINQDYDLFWWFCYSALIIVGISIFVKNSSLIISQLNILIIPSLIWAIDFFSALLLGIPPFGRTAYFFEETRWFVRLVSLQHLFTIPLVLYSLYLIKIKKLFIPVIISLFHITLFYFISISLTNPEKNINCVFRSCIPYFNFGQFYPIAWFIAYIFIILVTYFSVTRLKFLRK